MAVSTPKLYGGYPDSAQAVRAGFEKIMTSYLTTLQSQEYSFWVVVQPTPGGTFYFTEPVTSGSAHFVAVTAPALHVRAFCQTHPKDRQVRFSDVDSATFTTVKKANGGVPVPFYMMGANMDLRLATVEKELPAGQTLDWAKFGKKPSP